MSTSKRKVIFGGRIRYQPKGSMCVTCKHKDRDCNHLEFDKMPIIDRVHDDEYDQQVNIVACLGHNRTDPIPPPTSEVSIPAGKTIVTTNVGIKAYIDGYTYKNDEIHAVLVRISDGSIYTLNINNLKAVIE